MELPGNRVFGLVCAAMNRQQGKGFADCCGVLMGLGISFWGALQPSGSRFHEVSLFPAAEAAGTAQLPGFTNRALEAAGTAGIPADEAARATQFPGFTSPALEAAGTAELPADEAAGTTQLPGFTDPALEADGTAKLPGLLAQHRRALLPSTLQMVIEALQTKDRKKGASISAIKKFILTNYPAVGPCRLTYWLKLALNKGLNSGVLMRPSNSTATGTTGTFLVSRGMLVPLQRCWGRGGDQPCFHPSLVSS